jgi:hypothetical protein
MRWPAAGVALPEGPGTILGGLPVIAEVSFGVSDGPDGRDYWAEVDTIYWMKRNGSKGKAIPQHIRDRAEKYDYYFCNLIEQVQDHLVYQDYLRNIDDGSPLEEFQFQLLDTPPES